MFTAAARRATRFAFVAALSACLSAAGLMPRARAQAATATLSGTVVDEKGAVIPGASVTVSNASTGLQRRLLTDGVGRFNFPMLPPGKYTVRVVSEGFAPVEIRDPELNVNDHLAYRIELKVGGVGAYVLVEDSVRGQGSAGLSSAAAGSAASVSTLIDRHLVENLPLNGQSFQSLLSLSPGSVQTRASFNEQGQFSFNGQRANANYFTVDGVSVNFGVSAGAAPGQAAAGSLPALSAFGGTNGLVSAEALQELRIQTSAYAPEFGRLPGAQVSLVTRPGTNDFHGSAFEYFRHEALSTFDWFASSRTLDKPRHRLNNFGGTLGGPLLRNKVFFFSSYEGLRLSQPVVTITEVPSLELRQQSPAALRPFLNAFPVPNWGRLTGVGVGPPAGSGVLPPVGRGGLEEFAASYSDPARLDSFAVRLDANAGEQLFLFGRYSYSPSETVQRGRGYVFGTSGQSLNTLNRTSSGIETLTAGATWVASSEVVNEARVNWSRAEGSTSLTLDGFGGAVPVAVEQFVPPGARPDVGLQFLILGGVSTSLGLGKGADNRQRQFNLVNNLSAAKSSHQLKFGVDYRRLSPVYRPAEYFQQVTFPAGTEPLDNPAVREGKASQVSIFADGGARFPLFTNVSAFAQDVWHPAARLTLTYGVRWELSPPPTERRGNRPLHALNFEDPSTVALAPAGAPLWKTSYLNFAPRLGAAIQPLRGRNTTIRAGVGIYYDAGGGQAAQVFGSVQPYTSVRRLEGVAYPLTAAQAAPPTQTPAPPFDTVYAFAPDLKLPYSLQWHVTVEQPLGAHQTLAASYTAAAGRRLLRQGMLSPNQNFRELRVVTNTATSDYRALLVQYQHRLARGLQALASYTWARSVDNASGDSDVNGAAGTPLLPPERTASDFDVRHSASAALAYDVRSSEKWGVLRLLLGDLSADAIFRARTATPVSVFFGRTLLSGDSFGLVFPDIVPGRPFYVEDIGAPGWRRINREAFAAPGSTGRPLARNALRGFGMWQADVGLRRRFALTERVQLQLRAEVFNVFNHPSFGNPVGDLGSGLFGQSIQTLAGSLGSGGVNGGLSPAYQIGGTRSMQLGLRLQF
jgi:Carboxypeptidase regulatory-like domain